ncbi:MAG: gliding motility-associated C-terminal domain-containing protein [Chitinophagales bacterium]
MLDAGTGFSSYLWQDGSQQQQFTVTDTGSYRVDVTDGHHCMAADSIHIAEFAASPQQILPADTIVCSYTGALIRAAGDFEQYNWSTGETGQSIQVTTAGEYVLQFVDEEGCVGKDSIRVDMKSCDALLLFSNAFTPNHDGANDVFRLRYPGHVSNCQLQVFDRWGQRIFATEDASAGWDSSFGGSEQPVGTYSWITRYTDNNGQNRTLSGTVVLIR